MRIFWPSLSLHEEDFGNRCSRLLNEYILHLTFHLSELTCNILRWFYVECEDRKYYLGDGDRGNKYGTCSLLVIDVEGWKINFTKCVAFIGGAFVRA